MSEWEAFYQSTNGMEERLAALLRLGIVKETRFNTSPVSPGLPCLPVYYGFFCFNPLSFDDRLTLLPPTVLLCPSSVPSSQQRFFPFLTVKKETTRMTGSSTPTRSCLKRRLQAAKNSLSGSLSSNTGSASSASSPPTRAPLCKTVSFDGQEHIYFADPDYDRHSVPVAAKLSYESVFASHSPR